MGDSTRVNDIPSSDTSTCCINYIVCNDDISCDRIKFISLGEKRNSRYIFFAQERETIKRSLVSGGGERISYGLLVCVHATQATLKMNEVKIFYILLFFRITLTEESFVRSYKRR